MATLIYSQYTDATKSALQAYFGVATDPDHFPQDPATFPNQCVIASSDPLYIAYYESFPSWWTESWVKPG
jgi:hypothetical protein